MKYTWIYVHLDPATGEKYWTLHKGRKYFNRLYIFGLVNNGLTKEESIMKKWKDYYNAYVYISSHINKKES